MKPRLFGTDGIRAPFGEPPLDPATLTALARGLADTLIEASTRPDAPRVILGGDTRDSTSQIAAWIAAGLADRGVEPLDAGIIPTPGVARLVREHEAAGGVAISASHNPWPDNGVKLIDAEGFKWSPAAEAALEQRLDGYLRRDELAAPTSVEPHEIDPSPYLEAVAESVLGDDLDEQPIAGLRVALDTGNGAATPFAADLFTHLGADVVLLGDEPDGQNINLDCGSTHPEALAAAVVEYDCDLGLAFDGDADRVIPVDETGTLRDGDALLYLWARSLHRRGELDPARIVVTSMSNLGLERALSREGIAVSRCGVGDREVVAMLRGEGIALGGEQSGHIIHLGLTTTGDGLLTGLQLARLLAEAGQPFSELLSGFERYPQILQNVRVGSKPELSELPAVTQAAQAVERQLGADGRLVLRYSGTEPLARIMIEGPDEAVVRSLAGELATAIEAEIGA